MGSVDIETLTIVGKIVGAVYNFAIEVFPLVQSLF